MPEAEDEPPRNTVDRDILRQVWNQPRPAELDIDIDATKAEEVYIFIHRSEAAKYVGWLDYFFETDQVGNVQCVSEFGRHQTAGMGHGRSRIQVD